jgi:hypothetical protein
LCPDVHSCAYRARTSSGPFSLFSHPRLVSQLISLFPPFRLDFVCSLASCQVLWGAYKRD